MKETPMINTIAPLTGWALDSVAELDRHAPGFAGSYLRASDERRQVIAAYLAVAPIPFDDGHRARLSADFLGGADHRAILRAGFGSVPVGLRGALARYYECGSAWKKDPGSGVIGVEKGPLIPVV
jgi:hypothetical protein